MVQRTLRSLLLLFCLMVGVGVVTQAAHRQGTPPTREPQVDAVFAQWNANTPGCAVGVALDGKAVLEKGYGMADLEHDVRNVAETIFEAGSVSKQFTAAAVLLLARDGKLSLDDPVRKYIPELPDYGKPLLIRHMLNHTSGLRDWGEVEAIAGWPRTSRVYTHAHVLDIVSRQRSLNFAPGTNWSYSNTGYNLAAIIVSRVSGQSFADFCRARIFQPLGMTRTSWRDDFRRIVKGRAIAYVGGMDGYRQEMPFENVHGNGGLLTTVGDLLRWNENFVTPKVGDQQFVQLQQQPGRFNDGKQHDYAFGLYIRNYKGSREVSHSGSTAGYRAYLTRYPNENVSVAVLCNAGSAQPERYAHAVADLYLADRRPGSSVSGPPRAVAASPQELAPLAGMYRNTTTGAVQRYAADKETLRIEGGQPLIPLGGGFFTVAAADPSAGSRNYDFSEKGKLRVQASNGTEENFERVEPVKPTPAELQPLAGRYSSDEAELTMDVLVENGQLVIARRPDTKLTLQPLYKDAFAARDLGTVIFRRDAKGSVTGFSVVQGRVWDLRFERGRASSAPTTTTY